MGTLRTPESEQAYNALISQGILEKGCALCHNDILIKFDYWKIIVNDFPYDRIAKTHHMVVPLRHVSESDLAHEEKDELSSMKEGYINDNYEYIIEATRKKKSIPAHFHLHLIVAKD